MTRKRAEVRRDEIVETALILAAVHGYDRVTRGQIGAALGLTGQAVMYHFSGVDQLRRHVMRAAIRHRVLAVVAQGLVQRDPIAEQAPADLKHAALNSMC